MFEEKAAKKGHSSQVTEAHKFVEELGTSLTLEHSTYRVIRTRAQRD